MVDTALAHVAEPLSEPVAAGAAGPSPSSGRRTPGSWGLRGLVIAYVGILVVVPVAILVWRAVKPGWGNFSDTMTDPETIHAFQVTGIVAGAAVVINTVFGIATAILLARYSFPGKRLLNALIDLPVAVSPIVVGIALLLVYGPDGWLGSAVTDTPLQVFQAKWGMIMATVFVSLPLVTRALVPVLTQVGLEQEQAATSLGASAVSRFVRITLPTIRTALAYGVVLTIARCLGEYGAVLVISGNVEGQTETVPLRIGNLYEVDFKANQAYALTFVLLLVALVAIAASAWIRRTKGVRS